MVKSGKQSERRHPRSRQGESRSPATEALILQAARREFIDKGLAGARMQAIADAAGVNKALLHYYFRSKENLYSAALDDIIRTVWGRLREATGGLERAQEPKDLVRILVSTYLRTLAAHPDFFRLMLREMADGGERISGVVEKALGELGDVPRRILAMLQAEIGAGRLKPLPPVHFVFNLMGMTVFTFFGRPLAQALGRRMGFDFVIDEAFLKHREEIIVDTLFHGLALPAGREGGGP